MASLSPKFQKEMKKYRNKATDGVKAAVLIGTKKVETSAKISIQRGGKTGLTYEKYIPRRTHIASAPGESPATDQGTLVQGINGYVDAGGLSGGVESLAPHAEPLELGTRNIEARPYLQPALEENRKQIIADIGKALKNASIF